MVLAQTEGWFAMKPPYLSHPSSPVNAVTVNKLCSICYLNVTLTLKSFY